jgi:hypothetical protein
MKSKEEIADRQRAWREKNKERIRERRSKKYKENREEILAARRARIKNNPEHHERVKSLKRASYRKHRESVLEKSRAKYAEDESYRELISDRGKKHRESWSEEKKEVERARLKQYREENKEHSKKQSADYYQKNKEKIIEKVKIYRLNNKDNLFKKANERKKKLRKEDPNFKLMESISQHTRIIFSHIKKEKGIQSEQTIKCSIEELKERFDNLFTKGMSWENHGIGSDKWQIDHIVPVSWFVKNMPDKAWLANCYWNLQPMWAIENIMKNDDVNQKGIDNFFAKLEQHENK